MTTAKLPETDRRNYIRELMGLLAENSRGGVATCPVTLEIMDTVPDAIVPPEEYAVWGKMKELAALGSPPNVMALRRALPGIPGDYWVTLRSDESSIRDLRDAVLEEATMRGYVEMYRRLGQMLKERKPFSEINEMLGNTMDDAVAGTPDPTSLSSFSYMDHVQAMRDKTIPYIRTPWESLNRLLGGGLYMGGDRAMTGLLAYTSVGKTRVAQQINWQAGRDGHVTDVFAGESNALAYKLSMGQMLGYINREEMSPDTMTDETVRRLREAEAAIDAMNTAVYDKAFNLNRIRGVMVRTARRMKEMKTKGTLSPNACQLVIVDNIDHAIGGGSDKEWQELEQAAKGLYNTAQRLNAHIIILAQSKLGGFLLGYPPGLNDFARAGLIASHCANILGLYRPINYEQVNAPEGDTRLIAKMTLSKARGAQTGTHLPHIDKDVGLWN